MKTIFTMVMVCLWLMLGNAHAASMVGQCVYPNIEPFKINVYVYAVGDELSETHINYRSYSVGMETNGRVGLWTVPDYSKESPYEYAGFFVGWVEKTQMDLQALRNCS